MIIVTGATGQLGRAIVEALVARVPPDHIGVSVRDPARAGDLQTLGVRVRRGDFDDADSLRSAFEGAAQVLIVSSNARASGGDPLAQHRSAINAAKVAGARRIVYTSHMAASPSSAFPPMRDHAATEAMLGRSGCAWTALRNGFYAASGIAMMGDALTTGVIAAPADGPVAWTAHADLAEAAAVILASEGSYAGPTPPLTATEALDLDDMARVASALLGREVRRDTITEDALGDRLTERGAPPAAAAIALGLYRAARGGEFAATDPTLERLIGHPPATMRGAIAEAMEGTRPASPR